MAKDPLENVYDFPESRAHFRKMNTVSSSFIPVTFESLWSPWLLGIVVQVVEPSKVRVLSSNPSTGRKHHDFTSKDYDSSFFFLDTLGFELRASCLLGKCSYCLSHSASLTHLFRQLIKELTRDLLFKLWNKIFLGIFLSWLY
jgi:hypothetical protein